MMNTDDREEKTIDLTDSGQNESEVVEELRSIHGTVRKYRTSQRYLVASITVITLIKILEYF